MLYFYHSNNHSTDMNNKLPFISSRPGFTLIELLVVIAIIGLLSTLSILSLNSARARARDAKRQADVKQIQTALEMYYNDAGAYPASATAGSPISYGGATFLAAVPTPPTPTNDGSCTTPAPNYTYATQSSNSSYTITYCLGAQTGSVAAGWHTGTPAGIK
jgi:prepilin-type N-terminal cleavage/methylation domain-containing protein